MPRKPSLAYLPLLISLGCHVPAFAEQSKLILPPPPLSAADSIKADHMALLNQMRSAFSASGRVTVAEESAVNNYVGNQLKRSGEKNAVSPEKERLAEELLNTGWDEFKNLRLAAAIEKLEKSKLIYREILPGTWNNKKLLTAYLHLGIAYLANGEKTRGQQVLREMLILDPSRATRKLNPKYYTPEVIQEYETVRKEVLEKSNQRLTLDVSPADAKIWFDGADIAGTAIEGLPEGEHFIGVRAAGHREYFSSKFIVSGDNVAVIRLERQAPQSLENFFVPVRSAYDLPAEVTGFIDGLASNVGGDIVLFYRIQYDAAFEPLTLEAQLFDQRSQETSSIESANLERGKGFETPARKLAQALLAQLDARGYVVSRVAGKTPAANAAEAAPITAFDPNATQKTRAVERRPWYRQWWPYAAIAGAVGLAVGGVLLFSDDSPSSSSLLIDNPTN